MFPFSWDPSYGARIGVLPLGADGAQVVWSEIDPCYVFHGVNAFRQGSEVVVDVCRHATMFQGGTLGSDLTLRRWTVDTDTGRATEEVVDERSDMELPSRDLRRTGREHRHGYFSQNRPAEDTVDLGGVIKHDYRTGERAVWDPGPTEHSGEWFFVGDAGGDADDEGWLLSYVTDEATMRSRFVVLDATDVDAGPVASVALPAACARTASTPRGCPPTDQQLLLNSSQLHARVPVREVGRRAHRAVPGQRPEGRRPSASRSSGR